MTAVLCIFNSETKHEWFALFGCSGERCALNNSFVNNNYLPNNIVIMFKKPILWTIVKVA